VEDVVHPEPARAAGRGHEERGTVGLEVGTPDESHEVAGRDRARVALAPAGELASQLHRRGVRLGQDLGLDAAGPERRGDDIDEVAGRGEIDAGRPRPIPAVPSQRARRGGRSERRVLQGVEEGLAARQHAGVRGVLVDLELQERLATHPLAEERPDERVGPAPEVGDVDGKQPAVLTDDLGGRAAVAVPEHAATSWMSTSSSGSTSIGMRRPEAVELEGC
jgi:hypothetical protein